MSGAPGAPATARVWVLFGGGGGLWWLRLLKPGFRHCLALMNDGRHWLLVDPLSSHTEVTVLDADAGWDVPGWYRDQGLTVVPAVAASPPPRPAPWAPFTCVEAVKRLIGLHDPLVVTPWQLYRRLTRAAALSGPNRRGFPSMANLFKAPTPSAAATASVSSPAATPAATPTVVVETSTPAVNSAPAVTASNTASDAAAAVPATDPPWWATAPTASAAPAVADSAPAAAEPSPATAAPTSPATSDGAASDPAAADLQDTAKAAEALLQRRARSQAGTVRTSWRGVLGLNDLPPLRKRLLGE